MRRRAEQVGQTRQRIVEAAVALPGRTPAATAGPSRPPLRPPRGAVRRWSQPAAADPRGHRPRGLVLDLALPVYPTGPVRPGGGRGHDRCRPGQSRATRRTGAAPAAQSPPL